MKVAGTVVLLAVGAASTLGAVVPAGAAQAAPRVTKGAWTTTATVPDPTTGGAPSDTCEGLASARYRRALALPGPGVLRLTLTSTGDWGLAVRDARGRALGRADSQVSQPERLALRVRAASRVLVDACNFAGAPTARVSWTFTRT